MSLQAHASGSEVVGFLYEAGYLGPAEQPLELALLGGVSFLNLASAGLKGSLGVLLGRSGRPAYAVPSGTAAEQQDHIARGRTLAAYVVRLDCTHHGAYLKAFCDIAGMVYLTHVSGGKANLVSIAGITLRGLAGNAEKIGRPIAPSAR